MGENLSNNSSYISIAHADRTAVFRTSLREMVSAIINKLILRLAVLSQ